MAIKELFYDQRPVALLNPRASKRIDPRFKFTRNSIASFTGSNGLIQQVPANQPRLDYDPITRETKGLLLEPRSTNYYEVSSNITTATGVIIQGFTAASDVVVAPDGTQTADRVVETTATENHLIIGGQAFSVVAGEKWSASLFVKPIPGSASNRYPSLRISGGTSTFGSYPVVFDLVAKQSYTITTGIYVDSEIIDYPNGWKRICVTGIAQSTDAGASYSIGFYSFNTLSNLISGLDYTGDGTSGFYIWGGQVEKSDKTTSYIPTAGAEVTRAADLLSVDSLTLPQSGSVFVDSQATDTGSNSTLISLKNASNQKINLAMEQRSELYNSLALTYSIKGTVKPTLPYPVPTTNRERNIITWGTQNYQYNTDGARFAPSLSTTPGIPANLTQLSIGHDAVDPTKAFNGYINAVYLYNGEIPPTVAKALVRGELDPVNADTYSPVGPTGSLALIINTQGASSSGDKVFALPAESSLSDNDIVITWGDGTESGLDGAAAELGAPGLSHTYPSAGIYPVWVEGKLENLQFNNSASALDLVKIEAWGTTADGNDVFLSPSTMNSAFYGCSKLTSMPSSGPPDTSAVTDWHRAFRDCSSLTGTFPPFNFSAATSFFEAWYGCSGLTSFTAAGDQTQNVTNFSYAWYNCSGLTSFPLINTSAGTTFYFAWYGCSGLTSFPLINTASGTNFSYTWRGCSGLTSFPLINTAAGTDFSFGWYDCAGLTSFPLLNTATGSNFLAAWYNCAGLTSFPAINTALGTEFGGAWQGCSGLTSFPLLDTAAGTGFVGTWYGCSSLTSFPVLNTAAGTNFSIAWLGCTSLSSFPSLNLSAATGLASDASNTYTGFRQTWEGCTSLTTFPASMFNTTTCTRFLDAFKNCALSAASIENIIVSINAANTSNGNLGFQGGTNAAKSTWTANANTAYDALVGRGWTITFNA